MLERPYRRFNGGPWVLARVLLLLIALPTTCPVDLLLGEAQNKALVPFPELGATASLVLVRACSAYLRSKGSDESGRAPWLDGHSLPSRAGESGGHSIFLLLDLEVGQAEMVGMRSSTS